MRNPRALLRDAWAHNRPLTFVGGVMLIVLAATVAGIFLDSRVITGVPAWLKPTKFAVSISIYSFTLVWLLTFVQGHPRLVRLISWVTAVALAVEMVIIVGQVIRGTTSHFNVSTPLDTELWATMGISIVFVWSMNLLTAILLVLQRMPDSAFAWSLRLGVLVSFVGMGVAWFMVTPTPEQIAASEAGKAMLVAGAHSVGVADGGPGLPVVGWSTVGGDLRVPHFVGLHGLQALPLFGFLLVSFAPGWLRPAHRVALVWTAGVTYLGLVLLLTWQALRGQPMISPDAGTFTALLALFGTAGIVASVVVLLARSSMRHPDTV